MTFLSSPPLWVAVILLLCIVHDVYLTTITVSWWVFTSSSCFMLFFTTFVPRFYNLTLLHPPPDIQVAGELIQRSNRDSSTNAVGLLWNPRHSASKWWLVKLQTLEITKGILSINTTAIIISQIKMEYCCWNSSWRGVWGREGGQEGGNPNI